MQDTAALSRSHTALCLAIAAFAVAFTLPMLVPVPLLWYHPLEGAWGFEVTPTTMAMGWYGRLLWGGVAAGIGFGLGRFLVPARLARTRTAKMWWTLATSGVVLAAMTILVVTMAGRTPVPLAPPGAAAPLGAAADERTLFANEPLE